MTKTQFRVVVGHPRLRDGERTRGAAPQFVEVGRHFAT
jgi:hypothetical protein